MSRFHNIIQNKHFDIDLFNFYLLFFLINIEQIPYLTPLKLSTAFSQLH